jgi:ATP-dependent Lon protease
LPLEQKQPASIVLGGNIEVLLEQKQPAGWYRHLFAVLPEELQDTAFLDRLHAYLPGWEMPVINPASFASGYGFMSDYLAEILAELRRRNFLTHVSAQVSFRGVTQRNQDAVKKTTAGLLKLLHPHLTVGEVPRSVMMAAVEFAVEMRKRVVDQLAILKPGEFGDVSFACSVQ